MFDDHQDTAGSQELNPADTGRSGNEMPMPEQKTGDVQPSQGKTPGEYDPDATPDNPPSDRA